MPKMVKLHARVTLEVEVPEIVLECLIAKGLGKNLDLDLDDYDAKFFLSCGKIANDWEDYGYIPSSWLAYDAVEAGLVNKEDVII